jgi:hypothetical protein
MSHDEAADRLRWPVGTVRSRMARARDVLRDRLARRGVTADGAAIVASMPRPPVPPEWLDATVRGSLDFARPTATAAANIASARSVAIARRVLQTMMISKLSYLGAAGLGIVLALGGASTLAFQAAGDSKPTGSAPVAARIPVSSDAAPKQVAATEPRPEEDAALAEQIRQLESQVKYETAKLEHMLELLSEKRRKLEILRLRQRLADAPTSPTPARKIQKAGDSEKPFYVELGSVVMVVSPDGSRVGRFDVQTGRPKPLNLPAIRGDRREFIVVPGHISIKPYPLDRDRGPGVAMETLKHPWFIALDKDRDSKVTRIAGFNVSDGTWIDQAIPEPVDRSAVRFYPGFVVGLGRRLYALSTPARRWGALEFPTEAEAIPSYRGSSYWAEANSRLFRFNTASGRWDDIYAGAIEDKTADAPN